MVSKRIQKAFDITEINVQKKSDRVILTFKMPNRDAEINVKMEELEEEDRKRAYEERKAFFRTPMEKAERHATEALETRRAEEEKSRAFAKMITEGVYSDFTDIRPGKGVR